ncbi:MAG: menaquinone biosynthetic enzyme MqnA/MqnD family protein [Vicinamibacteraceae bacterium]
MTRIRLGAVGYLNTRPLVHGLREQPSTFDLRFDPPAVCADLLHTGQIDLGTIPSFEYLQRPGYRVVPELAIASDGPVSSVALFTARPVDQVRSIALDTSSRTSAVLVKLLCRHRFGIHPTFDAQAPDLEAMLARSDAALLIGDAALFAEHERLGAQKIDLGEAWTAMTGLPFVWAFWAGPETDAISPRICQLLREARDRGVAAVDEIARHFSQGNGTRSAVAATYLRTHIKYVLGPEHLEGVRRFHTLAVEGGLAPELRPVRFF